MSAVLDRMTAGFADPVHDAQRVFRVILAAMSRPGTIGRVAADAVDAIDPPSSDDDVPLGAATTAILLTLLDADTSVAPVGTLAGDAVRAYCRFHTGVRSLAAIDGAAFVVARAADVDAALRARLYLGSDETPQDGATMIIEVDGFGADAARTTSMTLRGPGIETTAALSVAGGDPAFWTWRAGLQSALPRGIDLIFTCDDALVAIPRSTRITLEG